MKKAIKVFMIIFAFQVLCPIAAEEHYIITPTNKTELSERLTSLYTHKTPFGLQIYFATDSSVIEKSFIELLKQLNDSVENSTNQQTQITIVGHTDNRASEAYNMALGQKRAKAIKQVLLSNNFSKNFLITNLSSMGESSPKGDNATDSGKALNRRVDLIISIPNYQEWLDSKVVVDNLDNTFLIVQNQDLVLWNTAEQCPQNILSDENEAVYALALSSSGKLALSGGSSHFLTLWDVATAQPLVKLTGHNAAISAIKFSQNRPTAISGSLGHEVKIWDLREKIEIANLQKHNSAISAVALSANGKYAASADFAGFIALWDLNTNEIASYSQVHESKITEIAFSENSNTLISISEDQRIHRWELPTNQKQYIEENQTTKISDFDISKNSQIILAAYDNGQIIQWDLKATKPLLQFDTNVSSLIAVSYIKNETIIMAMDSEKNVHFWDADTGKFVESFSTNEWAEKNQNLKQPVEEQQIWQLLEPEMTFTHVRAGCYDMGCGNWNNQCSASEEPVHKACTEDFWILKDEISQKQWTDVVDYNPSQNIDHECIDEDGNETEDCSHEPVNQVSWQDTQVYICKLNKKTGRIFRLPKEVEWEYACRDSGKHIKHFPLADTDSEETDNRQTDIYNMNDSVWEWTLDVFDKNSYSQHSPNKSFYSGNNEYYFQQTHINRSQRGGAWDIGANLSQCSRRHYDEPESRAFYTGFRLVTKP